MSDTIDIRSGAEGIAPALDLIGRKREGKPAPMACCPRCPGTVPLVSTCVFPGAEFYCAECGAKVGFLSPRPAEATDELKAEQGRLQDAFEADYLAGKFR